MLALSDAANAHRERRTGGFRRSDWYWRTDTAHSQVRLPRDAHIVADGAALCYVGN